MQQGLDRPKLICCVSGCTNSSPDTDSSQKFISFVKIPTKRQLKKSWFSSLKDYLNVSPESFFKSELFCCENHFLDSDFTDGDGVFLNVKSGVKPIFFPSKERIEFDDCVSDAVIKRFQDMPGNQLERSIFDHNYFFFPKSDDETDNICNGQEEDNEDSEIPNTDKQEFGNAHNEILPQANGNQHVNLKIDQSEKPSVHRVQRNLRDRSKTQLVARQKRLLLNRSRDLKKRDSAIISSNKPVRPKSPKKQAVPSKSSGKSSHQSFSKQNQSNKVKKSASTRKTLLNKRKVPEKDSERNDRVAFEHGSLSNNVEDNLESDSRISEELKGVQNYDQNEEVPKRKKKKIVKEIVAWIPSDHCTIPPIQSGTFKPLMILDGSNQSTSKSPSDMKIPPGHSQVVFTKDEHPVMAACSIPGTTPGLELVQSEVESMQTTIRQLTSEIAHLKKKEKTMTDNYAYLAKEFDEYRHFAEKKVMSEVKNSLLEKISENHLKLLLGEATSNPEWTDEEVQNALTLYGFSQGAYNFVRNVLHYPLPSPLYLRRFSLQQKKEFLSQVNLVRMKKSLQKTLSKSQSGNVHNDSNVDCYKSDLGEVSPKKVGTICKPQVNGICEIELQEIDDKSDIFKPDLKIVSVESLGDVFKHNMTE